MELADVKILIERYYDGETTLAEEAAIADYLATHSDLPAELEATRVILLTTSTMREVKAPAAQHRSLTLRRRVLLGISGVAVAAVVLFGIMLGVDSTPQTIVADDHSVICYKDGVALDSEEAVMAEASRILGGVSADVQVAMTKIERLNILAID